MDDLKSKLEAALQHAAYWKGSTACECASVEPIGACLHCDMDEMHNTLAACLDFVTAAGLEKEKFGAITDVLGQLLGWANSVHRKLCPEDQGKGLRPVFEAWDKLHDMLGDG